MGMRKKRSDLPTKMGEEEAKRVGAITEWTEYPRAIVEFGRTDEPEVLDWTDIAELEVDVNLTWEADAARLVLDNTRFASDYLRKEMPIRIYTGRVKDRSSYRRQDLRKIFSGRIDGVLPRFTKKDRQVEIRARDMSRILIDAEYSKSVAAASASEVAAAFAKEAGLKAKVSKTTRAPEMETFEKKSRWEVLQILGLREGHIVWVDADEVLHFHPRSYDDPFIAEYRFDVEPYTILEAEFDDSAVGIPNRIIVLRYLGGGQYARGEATDERRVEAMGGRVVERTVYSRDAESDEEAEAEAKEILAEKGREAITARLKVEGFPELLADTRIKVRGNLGRFAGDYYINRAVHHLSKRDGYTVDLDLTNIRPEASEVYKDSLADPKQVDSLQLSSNCGDARDAASMVYGASDGGAATPGSVPEARRGVRFRAVGVLWEIMTGFKDPYEGEGRNINDIHRGLDIFPVGKPNYGEGEPAYAFQPGLALEKESYPYSGKYVMIKTDEGLYDYYFHLSRHAGVHNQRVERGDLIGYVGSTGANPAYPHIHYEVRRQLAPDPNHALIDPLPYAIGNDPSTVDMGATFALQDLEPNGSTSTAVSPVIRNAVHVPSAPNVWVNSGSHRVPNYPEAGAIDIFAAVGEPIYAPVSGTSSPATYPAGGNATLLQGDNGIYYYFAHGRIPFTGGSVARGQKIGEVGCSGSASCTTQNGQTVGHLHLAGSRSNAPLTVYNGKGEIRLGSEYFLENGGPPPDAPDRRTLPDCPPTDGSDKPAPGSGVALPTTQDSVPCGRDAFIAAILPWAKLFSQSTGLNWRVFVAISANETGWGCSELAQRANSLFGVKWVPASPYPYYTLPTCWEVDASGNDYYEPNCRFERYDNPAQALQGFVEFLRRNKHYQPALDHAASNPSDVRGFVQRLKNVNYATDPTWVNKIVSIADSLAAYDTDEEIQA